jgi:hypothetical protein
MHWEDKFISMNHDVDHKQNLFICWDHLGEYIDSAKTKEEARQIVKEYSENLNKRLCRN